MEWPLGPPSDLERPEAWSCLKAPRPEEDEAASPPQGEDAAAAAAAASLLGSSAGVRALMTKSGLPPPPPPTPANGAPPPATTPRRLAEVQNLSSWEGVLRSPASSKAKSGLRSLQPSPSPSARSIKSIGSAAGSAAGGGAAVGAAGSSRATSFCKTPTVMSARGGSNAGKNAPVVFDDSKDDNNDDNACMFLDESLHLGKMKPCPLSFFLFRCSLCSLCKPHRLLHRASYCWPSLICHLTTNPSASLVSFRLAAPYFHGGAQTIRRAAAGSPTNHRPPRRRRRKTGSSIQPATATAAVTTTSLWTARLRLFLGARHGPWRRRSSSTLPRPPLR